MYGGLLVHQFEASAFVAALKSVCRVAADTFLVGVSLLALPMVIASAMDGLVGLEATRGLRRLGAKTLASFVGAGLVVLLLMLLLGAGHFFQCFGDRHSYQQVVVRLEGVFDPRPSPTVLPTFGYYSDLFSAPFWFAATILSLGFGLYRNRIGEGRAHLLLRWWRGVDEITLLTAGFLRKMVPLGIFALVFTVPGELALSPTEDGALPGSLACIAACWAIYAVVVLPLILWGVARVNPWRYARVWWPAVATAFCSGTATVALPLALEGLRRRTGISNRVTCVVLPLGASVQRDGIVLGWMALALYLASASSGSLDLTKLAGTGLSVWAMSAAGIPLGGLALSGLALSTQVHSLTLGRDTVLLSLWITCGGAAVSQWSVACVTAVVAHWEGERDLLTPKPPEDPLFGERLSKDFV